MTSRLRLLGFFVATLSALAASGAQSACDFKKVGELPVTMSGLRPTVPAKLNGVDVRFVVDSGAFLSIITWGAATKTGVHPRGSAKGVRGVSGEAAMDVGVVSSFDLAGMPFGAATFLVGGDVIGEDVAGLLGQNLLGRLDVEYDLANGVIRLFTTRDCRDAYLAYWAANGTAGVLEMAPRSKFRPDIIVAARVNDQPIKAILDTGASTSMLKLSAASRAGIKSNTDGVKTAGVSAGISGRPVDTWLAPVSSFAFGDEQIRNTRLRIADIELEPADMLLGADFFLSHRIFVSNSQERLYFTYNGGPVFRLDGPAPPPAASEPQSQQTPENADAYARRAAAFVARGDTGRALADYARAIEMEPNSAQYYFARAATYVRLSKADLARADLDKMLRLTPGDTPARMLRARLLLQARELAQARADIDATLKDLPADSMQVFEVAALLEDEGYYSEAVAHLDRYLAAHPDDDRTTTALNSRCWARGIWGQELNLALADCDAALKRGPRRSSYFDSRGLVRLRQGQYAAAIEDYSAALRIYSKIPWSLYGRGLARMRLGQTAAGEADIAAAVAIDPGLPALAKRYGLDPVDKPAT